MAYAAAFRSEAPVFFASDLSYGIAEGMKAFPPPQGTKLPCKFMLERL